MCATPELDQRQARAAEVTASAGVEPTGRCSIFRAQKKNIHVEDNGAQGQGLIYRSCPTGQDGEEKRMSVRVHGGSNTDSRVSGPPACGKKHDSKKKKKN